MLNLSVKIESVKQRIKDTENEMQRINDLVSWSEYDTRRFDTLVERKICLKEMLDLLYNLLGD